MLSQFHAEDQDALRLKLKAVEPIIVTVEGHIARLGNRVYVRALEQVANPELDNPGLLVAIREALAEMLSDTFRPSLIESDLDQAATDLGPDYGTRHAQLDQAVAVRAREILAGSSVPDDTDRHAHSVLSFSDEVADLLHSCLAPALCLREALMHELRLRSKRSSDKMPLNPKTQGYETGATGMFSSTSPVTFFTIHCKASSYGVREPSLCRHQSMPRIRFDLRRRVSGTERYGIDWGSLPHRVS